MFKHFAMTAVLAALAVTNAGARETRSINDGWRFAFVGDTVAETVHLPHSWNGDAYLKRDYRRGSAVYSRDIHIPENGARYILKIDGAASKSQVAVDGRQAGRHVGGYSAHVVDITPYVTPGSTHRFDITVDNSDCDVPPYSADFTFMGGLYRDVWLTVMPEINLSDGVRVTPRADGLTVEGRVANDADRDADVKVTVTVYDPDGEVAADGESQVRVGAHGATPYRFDLTDFDRIRLWSPEAPELYRVEVTAGDDKVDTYTGFRSFSFDESGRFMLNGKPYKLRGMCRHQDQRPMGIALSDDQHRRDIEMVKDLGANFIRISHYPQDDAVLEMCDRLGLIAWEEIPVIDYVPPGETFADNSETMLREMIRKHYNHPSIAMWGYMNEILLREPAGERDSVRRRTLDLARRLERAVHEEDPTRLTTMAFHGNDVYDAAGLTGVSDVQGWNLYQGWYGGELTQFEEFLSRRHRLNPDARLIVSEYGAGSDLRIHSLDPEPFDFSVEYQQEYLEHYLPVIEDSAFVAGASHWNFIDFSSANRAESMPRINNKGLVTNDRRKKDVFYYYKSSWTDLREDTVAHIAVRDWADRTEIADNAEGTVVRPIKVYTNLPSVALRVNGMTHEPRETVNSTAVFDVALRDGKNVMELVDPDDTGRVLDVAAVGVSVIARDGQLIDSGTDAVAVNVGSDCYFRSNDSGLTWLPDREYSPGSLYGHRGGRRTSTQDEIACTADGPLLQRSLSGLDEYRFDLVGGRYEVELSFADLSSPSEKSAYLLGREDGTAESGSGGMDIAINGCTVERDFSAGREAGVKTRVTRRYVAEVGDDGVLSVTFTAPPGSQTSLSAIKIRKL